MENLTGEQYKLEVLLMDVIGKIVEARESQSITSHAALGAIRKILAIGE